MPKQKKRTAKEKRARNRAKNAYDLASRKRAAANFSSHAALEVKKDKHVSQLTEEEVCDAVLLGDHTRKMRNVFAYATLGISTPMYLYGTGLRTLSPETYYTHLDAITGFTSKHNIPYDADFQTFYMGSFGGALFIPIIMRGMLEAYGNIKLIDSGKYKDIETAEDIYNFNVDKNRLERNATTTAFTTTAIGLTANEYITSHGPNRSFDYGDMTAYALALTILIGGMKLASKRALKTAPTVATFKPPSA